jgi:hypothetical protein
VDPSAVIPPGAMFPPLRVRARVALGPASVLQTRVQPGGSSDYLGHNLFRLETIIMRNVLPLVLAILSSSLVSNTVHAQTSRPERAARASSITVRDHVCEVGLSISALAIDARSSVAGPASGQPFRGPADIASGALKDTIGSVSKVAIELAGDPKFSAQGKLAKEIYGVGKIMVPTPTTPAPWVGLVKKAPAVAKAATELANASAQPIIYQAQTAQARYERINNPTLTADWSAHLSPEDRKVVESARADFEAKQAAISRVERVVSQQERRASLAACFLGAGSRPVGRPSWAPAMPEGAWRFESLLNGSALNGKARTTTSLGAGGSRFCASEVARTAGSGARGLTSARSGGPSRNDRCASEITAAAASGHKTGASGSADRSSHDRPDRGGHSSGSGGRGQSGLSGGSGHHERGGHDY